MDPAPGASYRALLVGIDAYAHQPLSGCVNDIDAIQRILLERVGVPPARIRRLASPHPDATPATAIPAQPATLANLRAALAALAAEAGPGDRVLIYYSGHGLRVPCEQPGGRRFHREALVPVDFAEERSASGGAAAPNLLFDHELNQLLGELARRTPAVTLVLDCCHSAGATRGANRPRMRARTFDPTRIAGLRLPLREGAESARRGDGIARTVDDCHVVAACLNHELAQETEDERGTPHGLLTAALVRALGKLPDAELPVVPWSRIWQAMRDDVEGQNPWQHLWMSGSQARAALAGPPVESDPGFAVHRVGDHYEIDAGWLAAVTDDAQVAVYGERTARFPPLDSEPDLAARCGVLQVTIAHAATAWAEAVGPRFELPPSARGRLIKPGAPARLRCAIVPMAGEPGAAAEELAAALRRSSLLEVVERDRARVRLEQVSGRWLLTDEIHEAAAGRALFVLTAPLLHRARSLLEHYARYALPLRMAESARDLPGALQLRVLACPEPLTPAAAQAAPLEEAPTIGTSAYRVSANAPVCFEVENTARVDLRVTLLNAASSGRVQILGSLALEGRSAHRFWDQGELGAPFVMTVPPGKELAFDRLIAIGTTAQDKDLSFLSVETRFLERGRDVGTARPPVDLWTATQAIVQTHNG